MLINSKTAWIFFAILRGNHVLYLLPLQKQVDAKISFSIFIAPEQSGSNANAIPLSFKSPQLAKGNPTLVPDTQISQYKSQIRIKIQRYHPLQTGSRCIISRLAAGMDSDFIFILEGMQIFSWCLYLQSRFEMISGHFPWLAPRQEWPIRYRSQLTVLAQPVRLASCSNGPSINATHGRDQSQGRREQFCLPPFPHDHYADSSRGISCRLSWYTCSGPASLLSGSRECKIAENVRETLGFHNH